MTEVAALGSDPTLGLSAQESTSRQSRSGPNAIRGERPPSMPAVALKLLRDPMNLMLIAVTVVSLLIGQVSTGIVVALLLALNAVLGSRPELKARANVDTLAKLHATALILAAWRPSWSGRMNRASAGRAQR